MNDRIGILNIDNSGEQDLTFEALTSNCEYEMVAIENEEQLEDIVGLIILARKEIDYISICEWLVSLRSRRPLFVWIICKECNQDMRNLYCKLATNSIVEVIQSNTNNQYLLFQIKNAIDFQNKLLTYKQVKTDESSFYLDEKNLKLIVEGNEICLTRLEFKLISILNDNKGEAVGYEKIIDIIWPGVTGINHKYRVANLVFNLRKKMKKQSSIDIQIIRTRGYLLVTK